MTLVALVLGANRQACPLAWIRASSWSVVTYPASLHALAETTDVVQDIMSLETLRTLFLLGPQPAARANRQRTRREWTRTRRSLLPVVAKKRSHATPVPGLRLQAEGCIFCAIAEGRDEGGTRLLYEVTVPVVRCHSSVRVLFSPPTRDMI